MIPALLAAALLIPPPAASWGLVTTHRDATRWTSTIAAQVAAWRPALAVGNRTMRPYLEQLEQGGTRTAFYQSALTSRHQDPVPQCDALDEAGHPLIRPAADDAVLHDGACPAWQTYVTTTARQNLGYGASDVFLDSLGFGTYTSVVDAVTGRAATPNMTMSAWLAHNRLLLTAVVAGVGQRVVVNCGSDGGWRNGLDQLSGCDDPTLVDTAQIEGYAATPETALWDATAPHAVRWLFDCKMPAYDPAWLDRCVGVWQQAGGWFDADVAGRPALQLAERMLP